jgi:hypothetical protein
MHLVAENVAAKRDLREELEKENHRDDIREGHECEKFPKCVGGLNGNAHDVCRSLKPPV